MQQGYERVLLALGLLFYAALLGASFAPPLSLDAAACVGPSRTVTAQVLLRVYASLQLVLLALLAGVYCLEEWQRGGPLDSHARECVCRNATPYLGTYVLLALHVLSSVGCAGMLVTASVLEWPCVAQSAWGFVALVAAALVLPLCAWLTLAVCSQRQRWRRTHSYTYVLPTEHLSQ